MRMTSITIRVPTLMLRIFLFVTIFGVGLLALLIGILTYYDAFHPSAFYPSRLQLQDFENIEPELVWGEWKIELPHANLLDNMQWKVGKKADCFFILMENVFLFTQRKKL